MGNDGTGNRDERIGHVNESVTLWAPKAQFPWGPSAEPLKTMLVEVMEALDLPFLWLRAVRGRHGGDAKSLIFLGRTCLQWSHLPWGQILRGAGSSELSSCWKLSSAAVGELRWAHELWGRALATPVCSTAPGEPDRCDE